MQLWSRVPLRRRGVARKSPREADGEDFEKIHRQFEEQGQKGFQEVLQNR